MKPMLFEIPAMPRSTGREMIVDNFAGGGGASEGIKMATGRDPDLAINGITSSTAGRTGTPLTKTTAIRCCGNSVCPPLAEALVRANYVEQPAVREAVAA